MNINIHHVVLSLGVLLQAACSRSSSSARLSSTPPGNYDLVAASVDMMPATVRVGDSITGEHIIRNAGRDIIPGGTHTVHFYLDGKLVSFDHATGARQPGTFSKYGCSPGHEYMKATKPGRIAYRLVVDEENNVPETDETNNEIKGEIEVIP
ncbi:CARDB domain-containing protein [Prosthecobacter sp.]|uniref:CARDB domain-containing protein n=1 Tax=Prosthecobacter sp. TaxID=1965333 RepID=UPI003782F1C8